MKKPRPAPSLDARTQKYRIHFSYQSQQYRRFYIENKRDAYILQEEVNHRVQLLRAGIVSIPPETTLPDFIFRTAEETAQETRKAASLSGLLDEYESLLAAPLKAETTIYTEKLHLRHLRQYMEIAGDPDLREIVPGYFYRYKQFRYANGIRTDTVTRELGTFQLVFQMAVDNGLVECNLVRDVRRDKSQVPCDRFRTHAEIKSISKGDISQAELREFKRYRYLTVEEIENLISLAKGKWLQPILITFAYTGMRRSELIRLEWADIDLERRFLCVRSKKQSPKRQNEFRQIPIHDRLFPILVEARIRNATAKWVFQGPKGGKLKKATLTITFQRLVRGTEFEGLGYHVFRHSLASNLAAKGAEQHYIDSILGHQTEAMRRRYRHLFPDKVEAALRMISIL